MNQPLDRQGKPLAKPRAQLIRKQYVVHAAGKKRCFNNAKSAVDFAKRMRKRHGGDASSYYMEEHSITFHKINQ